MNLTADENRYSVSVVIPAYNIEAYLARAIDSVLAQTQPPEEIIVVDDGSTDNTAEIARQYGAQVRYIYQSNAGPSAARNTGIRAAQCEWIAFLDGDDEWLPEKLELQIDVLRSCPNLVWCCSNCYMYWVNENRRILMEPTEQLEPLLAKKLYFDDYLIASAHGATGHQSNMIIKKQVLFEVGLYRIRDDLYFLEDHDIWWRIAYRWPAIGYLTQPLSKYYFNRPGNWTRCIPILRYMESLYDLIDGHLEIAARYGRVTELKIRIQSILIWLMRNFLEEKRYKNILHIIHRYHNLLSVKIRVKMRLKATFPYTSMCVLDAYHCLKGYVLYWRK